MKGSTGYSHTPLMDVGMLCFLLLMVSSLDTRFSVLAISLGHRLCVSGESCDRGEGQGSVSVERVVIGEVDGSPFGVTVHCCVALGRRRLALVDYCRI